MKKSSMEQVPLYFSRFYGTHLKAPAASPGRKAQGTLVEAQEPMTAAVQVAVVRFTQEDSTPATTRCETPGPRKLFSQAQRT
ncbi:hypothetical protein [Stutzerimonas nitrititolerans]|uniref:hypothetical protein n=2 Tax=Stutzerimonas nitrititolerans TaxID=2482751 RepID=UPI0028B08C7B|nr:hypothetical protein [Stutzerimonas nitrititolerans]